MQLHNHYKYFEYSDTDKSCQTTSLDLELFPSVCELYLVLTDSSPDTKLMENLKVWVPEFK